MSFLKKLFGDKNADDHLSDEAESQDQIVADYYRSMSDAQILQAIENNISGLTPAAQKIVKAEVKRRRLDPELAKAVDEQQQTDEYVPKVYDPEACPVDEIERLQIERSFEFLLNTFGKAASLKRKILVPHSKDFPVKYDGSERTAFETLKIVAKQMEVPYEKIKMDFYDETLMQITEGSPGGVYWGKTEHDLFEISLVNYLMDEPENMVATMAHEIAHIKLLGENRLTENDETLTDLAVIFFGFGVFNANTAFQTFRSGRKFAWSTSGYLSQMQWGYALALFAHIRAENEPDWFEYLCANVQGDFKQAQRFIANNPQLITVRF